MGLGPPVCLDCFRIMDYSEDGPPYWTCGCGNKVPDDDKIGNLFSFSKDQWETLKNNPPKLKKS